MADQPKKKIRFANISIALLFISISLCSLLLLNPLVAQSILAVGPTQCGIGNWQSFDMPDLAAKWQNKLKKAGFEATDVSAYGVGESTLCWGNTLLGHRADWEPPTNAANTGVYASIRVKSISDTALGDVVIQILQETDSLDGTDIHLTFIADQSKGIEFNAIAANELREQGLTNAELFQALDGRFTPPTATPSPTGD